MHINIAQDSKNVIVSSETSKHCKQPLVKFGSVFYNVIVNMLIMDMTYKTSSKQWHLQFFEAATGNVVFFVVATQQKTRITVH